MTLREEILKESLKVALMPKINLQCRYGSAIVKNEEEIIRFLESIIRADISNKHKLAYDIFSDIYQAGYEAGCEEEGNKED